MLKAGLTGGLASGKTFVGKTLAELGATLIQADVIGHEVLLPQGAAYSAVVAQFGTTILTAGGEIDRQVLANLVFSDPARLAQLNAIVHPAVFFREEELMAAAPPNAIVVVEAAILVETGRYKYFEKLIVATCTREQQIERALHRPGATLADVMARLDRQLPLAEKRTFADYIIDTSGTKQETLRQTGELYNSLKQLAMAKHAL